MKSTLKLEVLELDQLTLVSDVGFSLADTMPTLKLQLLTISAFGQSVYRSQTKKETKTTHETSDLLCINEMYRQKFTVNGLLTNETIFRGIEKPQDISYFAPTTTSNKYEANIYGQMLTYDNFIGGNQQVNFNYTEPHHSLNMQHFESENYSNVFTEVYSSGYQTAQGNANAIKQTIPLNSDNDNGSMIVEFNPEIGDSVPQYIPEDYDFEKSCYNNEDDLVELQVLPINLPEFMSTPGFYRYKLMVESTLPNGTLEGLKIWANDEKTIELPTDGNWTTAGMPVSTPGYFSLPNFLLEGTRPGKVRDQYKVTLTAEQHINGEKFVVNYKEVFITVAPVIDSIGFAETDPRIVEESNGAKWLSATLKAKTSAITDYESHEPYGTFDLSYVQHVKSKQSLLNGYIASKDNIMNYREQLRSNIGPNNQVWFLDSDAESAPYYPPDVTSFTDNGTVVPGKYNYVLTDWPGIKVYSQGFNWLYSDVFFSIQFRTELVWKFQSGFACPPVQDIIYPLGYIDWEVMFNMSSYGTEGCCNSLVLDQTFSLSNEPQYPYVPAFANNAWEIVPVTP